MLGKEETGRFERFESLEKNGVWILRRRHSKENIVLKELRRATLDEIERRKGLPKTMAQRIRGPTFRHFVPASSSPKIERLAGNLVRDILSSSKEMSKLRVLESTCIVSESGAKAQDAHSDGDYDAKKITITAFVALQDILDEGMGPTFFVPRTHAPRWFSGGKWEPPSKHGSDAKRGAIWLPLGSGDCVFMNGALWHYGGACGRKEIYRALFSFTLVEEIKGA